MPAERRIAHHHVMHNSGVALEFRIKAFLPLRVKQRSLKTELNLQAQVVSAPAGPVHGQKGSL
jgi:hypothetical protein